MGRFDPIIRRIPPPSGATLDFDFLRNTSLIDYQTAGYDPAAAAIINAMVPPPPPSRMPLINNVVLELKAAGVWDKCDIIYCFAAHSEQAACLNWKNTATFTAAKNGSPAPTFQVDRGYTGAGNGGRLTTGYNPATAAGRVFAQNSAHIGFWGNTNAGVNANGAVFYTNTQCSLFPLSTASNGEMKLNTSLTVSFAATDTLGHFITTRRDATNQVGFHSGTIGTTAATSVAVSSVPLTILGSATGLSYLGQVSWAHAGSALSDADFTAINYALRNYNHALGVIAADPALSIINAMVVPPTAARQTAIKTAVDAMVAAGSWTKMDLLYVMCAHHEQAARLNWKSPTRFALSYAIPPNAPTFQVDRGFTGTGVTGSFMSTGWNVSLDAVTFQRDSAHWAVLTTTEQGFNNTEDFSCSGNLLYQTKTTAVNGAVRLNSGTSTVVYMMSSAYSHNICIRPNATQQFWSYNALPMVAGATANSAVVSSAIVYLCARGTTAATASTRQVSVAHLGGALTDAENLSIYNAILGYRTAVGCIPNPVNDALAAMTVQPDSARATLYTNLINALVSAGIWDRLDLFYLFAAHDEQASRINLRYPGAFTAPNTAGPPIFTVDRGWEGNGTNAAMNIGFTPNVIRQGSTNGYTLNAATQGLWVQRANTINSTYDLYMGTSIFYRGTTSYQFRVNDGTTRNITAALPATGHYAARRTTSTESSAWIGGVNQGSGATVSTTCASATVLLSTGGAQWSNGRFAAMYLGGTFTDTQMGQMHTALNTYMTALGV